MQAIQDGHRGSIVAMRHRALAYGGLVYAASRIVSAAAADEQMPVPKPSPPAIGGSDSTRPNQKLRTDGEDSPTRATPLRTRPPAAWLNFENADLREVVRNILGDIMGVRYVIDPAVRGRISIRTDAAIPFEKLPATLAGLLRKNCATMVREDQTYKIIPITGVFLWAHKGLESSVLDCRNNLTSEAVAKSSRVSMKLAQLATRLSPRRARQLPWFRVQR